MLDKFELTIAELKDLGIEECFTTEGVISLEENPLPKFDLRVMDEKGKWDVYKYIRVDSSSLCLERPSLFKVVYHFDFANPDKPVDVEEIYADYRYRQWLYADANVGDRASNPVTIWMLVYFLIQFRLKHLPEVFIKETREKTVLRKNKHTGKYENRQVLINHYRINPGYKPKGGHNVITCPAWGVRGHYRHMKSGKVVFVKPHVKGKMRHDPEAFKAKVYIQDLNKETNS